MLSFRSILLAAAAFATIASAIPTSDTVTSGGPTNALRGFGLSGVLSSIFGGTDSGSGDGGGYGGGLPYSPYDGAVPELSGAPVKRGDYSCGDIIKKCHDDIAVIVLKIDAVVKVDGGAKYVNHDVAIDLLWEIVAILKVTLYDLKVIVKFELLLNGVACTLKELAAVVADLLILVIELVWLILSIVGFLDFTLLGVIATVGELLYEILEVVLFLVEDILAELVVLIVPYGDHCKFVKYDDILVLLKIVV